MDPLWQLLEFSTAVGYRWSPETQPKAEYASKEAHSVSLVVQCCYYPLQHHETWSIDISGCKLQWFGQNDKTTHGKTAKTGQQKQTNSLTGQRSTPYHTNNTSQTTGAGLRNSHSLTVFTIPCTNQLPLILGRGPLLATENIQLPTDCGKRLPWFHCLSPSRLFHCGHHQATAKMTTLFHYFGHILWLIVLNLVSDIL